VRAAIAGLVDSGRVLADLEAQGVALPARGLDPVQMVDLLPETADGKIHLCPEDLDSEAPGGLYSFQAAAADERHPLALLSPATSRTLCSTLGELERNPPVLEIHPRDALVRGIAAGDRVRIHNSWGEVRAAARLNPGLIPGVVLMAKGTWGRNAPGGHTVNSLIPDDLSDLAGGACFSDARVEVERLDEARGEVVCR
jgi:anaerobic selenocysteine-containing dehydrogenase